MGIIGWIVLGLIVGALAKLIMPGDDRGGIIVTMLLGIVGALIGGFIGKAVFGVGLGGFFEIRTWIIGLIGALVLLGIYRVAIAGRGRRGVRS